MNTAYEEHITKMKISLLLYMGDLKLISFKTEKGLQKQVKGKAIPLQALTGP